MTQALKDFRPELGPMLKLSKIRWILANDGGGIGDGVVFSSLIESAPSRAGIKVDNRPGMRSLCQAGHARQHQQASKDPVIRLPHHTRPRSTAIRAERIQTSVSPDCCLAVAQISILVFPDSIHKASWQRQAGQKASHFSAPPTFRLSGSLWQFAFPDTHVRSTLEPPPRCCYTRFQSGHWERSCLVRRIR